MYLLIQVSLTTLKHIISYHTTPPSNHIDHDQLMDWFTAKAFLSVLNV